MKSPWLIVGITWLTAVAFAIAGAVAVAAALHPGAVISIAIGAAFGTTSSVLGVEVGLRLARRHGAL